MGLHAVPQATDGKMNHANELYDIEYVILGVQNERWLLKERISYFR